MRRTHRPSPLSMHQLEELVDHVATQLESRPCDHTTRHAEAWCRARGLNVRATLDWLKTRGGWCDCEVWLNVL